MSGYVIELFSHPLLPAPCPRALLWEATSHSHYLPPTLPSLPPSLPPHLMATHRSHAFLMRSHIPHHEVRIIRASHAHVAIIRKGHGINTAKMPPESTVQPKPFECAQGRANPATHGLMRDARTLLSPKEQVKSERVVVMVVLVWRRRRRGTDAGRGCLLHGLGWSGFGQMVQQCYVAACRAAAAFVLCCRFLRTKHPWRTHLALQVRLALASSQRACELWGLSDGVE